MAGYISGSRIFNIIDIILVTGRIVDTNRLSSITATIIVLIFSSICVTVFSKDVDANEESSDDI